MIIVVVLFAVAGSFFSLWQGARDEVNELREELALATIVGRVYQDRGLIEALDHWDVPAENFKVRLYQIQNDENILVGEAIVDETGSYVFRVKTGAYYVLPVSHIPGYPAWNQIIHLQDSGRIKVEGRGIYLGPIFLLSQYTG